MADQQTEDDLAPRPSIREEAEETEAPAEAPETDADDRTFTEEAAEVLQSQCRERGMERAGTAAALQLFREGLVSGPPTLETIADYLEAAPREDVLNVPGIGPKSIEALEHRLPGQQEAETARRLRPDTVPECPICGSGMRNNGVRRGDAGHPFEEVVTRYYICKAHPDDEEHRTQVVSRERRR